MKLLDFDADNCELFTPRPIFVALFGYTGGNPCNGCSYIPTCDNYYKLHPEAKRQPLPKPFVPEKRGGKKKKNKNRAAF